MAKRTRAWRPDIFNQGGRRGRSDTPSGVINLEVARAAADWQPDVLDLAAAREPAALDIAVAAPVDAPAAEPLSPASVEVPATASAGVAVAPTTPARAIPTAAPRDNDSLVGLVAGAIVGAALILLVTPVSGALLRARLRRELEARAQAAGNQAQALAQNVPYMSATGQTASVAGEQSHA